MFQSVFSKPRILHCLLIVFLSPKRFGQTQKPLTTPNCRSMSGMSNHQGPVDGDGLQAFLKNRDEYSDALLPTRHWSTHK